VVEHVNHCKGGTIRLAGASCWRTIEESANMSVVEKEKREIMQQ